MAEEKKLSRLEELRLKKEQLELEALEQTVENERTRRETKRQQAERQEATQRDFELNRKRRQAQCNHRKGGLNVEGLVQGQGADALFAVNKQTHLDGRVWVLCTRCGKEWWPGDEGYRDAMTYPTDNIPSQSVTFNIPTHA